MNSFEGLTGIVCGHIDQRYGEALEGVHHAIKDGATLCGKVPRNTNTTVWFGRAPIRTEEHADCVTCKRCRRSMGLAAKHGSSKVLL